MIEARLFAHSEIGGFEGKENLRKWLRGDLIRKRRGLYFLSKKYSVVLDSLVFFEIQGYIVGCAVVAEPPHNIEEPGEESFWKRLERPADFTSVMRVDTASIYIWESHQDVALSEVDIRFRPGPPMMLDAMQVLRIFTLVAAKK